MFMCVLDIDECASTPGSPFCQNGGSCTNTVGGFSCSCKLGYTGSRCETGASPHLRVNKMKGSKAINLTHGNIALCTLSWESSVFAATLMCSLSLWGLFKHSQRIVCCCFFLEQECSPTRSLICGGGRRPLNNVTLRASSEHSSASGVDQICFNNVWSVSRGKFAVVKYICHIIWFCMTSCSCVFYVGSTLVTLCFILFYSMYLVDHSATWATVATSNNNWAIF